jgi:osmotically inducible lipoprotein OsmB
VKSWRTAEMRVSHISGAAEGRIRSAKLDREGPPGAGQAESCHHLVVLIVVAVVAMGGCAGMTETQQRTLTGGAAGAAGGALIGAIAGNAGLGAAIGAGTGLAGGYLYGKHEESTQDAYQRGLQEGARQSQPTSGSR